MTVEDGKPIEINPLSSSLCDSVEDCKPIEINEATRWKPKSLEAKAKGGDEADSAKLSTDEVLMKANAVLNKVQQYCNSRSYI